MATSHDDAYEKYDCSGTLWRRGHNPVVFAEGGNFLLGVSRVASFFILYGLNSYNRSLLRNRTDENTNVIPSLILPYYFKYFQLFILLSFIAGIIDIALQFSGIDDGTVNNWLIPIEQGLFHWLYEGLAFFLMRYGSGVRAMKMSLLYSAGWGFITFLLFFAIFSIFSSQYGFSQNTDTAFTMFLSYESSLFAFYLFFLLSPVSWVYRRDALTFYAAFNVAYYLMFVILGSLLYHKVLDAVCPGSALVFVFVGFLQPLALFRTLQIDSRYWQGLTPDPRNPMSTVWDHVDIQTAQSMAENLENVRSNNRKLPILHFGLLDIEQDNKFVPGGFSRVYFGHFRKQKVALKILFAMELTPLDVSNFYHEASLLHSLKHPNIVECMGICTMPPALAMVLENCKYGSLFDFLYKPLEDGALKRDAAYRMSHMSHNGRHSYFSNSAVSSLQAAFSSGPPQSMSMRLSFRASVANSNAVDAESRFELTATGSSAPSSYTNRGSLTLPNQLQTTTNPMQQQNRSHQSQRPNSRNGYQNKFGGNQQQQSRQNSDSSVEPNPLRHSLLSADSGSSSVDISTYQHHAAITGEILSAPLPSSSSALSSANGIASAGILDDQQMNTRHTLISNPRASQLTSIDLVDQANNTRRHLPSSDTLGSEGYVSRYSQGSGSAYSNSISNQVPTFGDRGSVSTSMSQQTALARMYGSVSYVVSQTLQGNITGAINHIRGVDADGQGNGGGVNRPSLAVHYTMAHGISLHDRIVMMQDAVAGIAFLHAKGFLHCDIKSLNFLVDENFRVKLADLGEARAVAHLDKYEKPPTPARNWAPPEVVLKTALASAYTERSEVYALCIVLAEIALLELPFGESPERVTQRTWYETLVTQRVRPILPLELPAVLRDVIERGMESDHQQRPSAIELLTTLTDYLAKASQQQQQQQSDGSSSVGGSMQSHSGGSGVLMRAISGVVDDEEEDAEKGVDEAEEEEEDDGKDDDNNSGKHSHRRQVDLEAGRGGGRGGASKKDAGDGQRKQRRHK